MKTFRLPIVFMFMVLAFAQIAEAQFPWGDLLKGAQKALRVGGGLSDSKMVDGLKEALHIGTGNAVQIVSKVGGYYNNPNIRVPLPGTVQKVEKLIRAAGYGKQVDAFELSMNQAAEKAAPEAKSIFWDAIKLMSFTDAREILDGPDNAATLIKYLTEQQIKALRRTVRDQTVLDKKKGKVTGIREWMVIDLLTCTGVRVSEATNVRCGDLKIGYGQAEVFVRWRFSVSAWDREVSRERLAGAV